MILAGAAIRLIEAFVSPWRPDSNTRASDKPGRFRPLALRERRTQFNL